LNDPKVPSDQESELAILCGLMLGHKQSGEVIEQLNRGHFFDPRHRIIFTTITMLFNSNEPLDLPSVHVALLNNPDDLEHAGGIAYLASIVDRLNLADDLNHHVRCLLRVAAHRRIQRFAEELSIRSQDRGSTPSEMCDQAIHQLSEISRDCSVGEGITERAAAIELMQSLEGKNPTTIFTGIGKLDEITGGFRPGEIVILTAQTGVGKTFLALQTKRRSCRSHKHGLFCSGEMLAPHLMGRNIAAEARVPYFKLRNPKTLTPDDYSALVETTASQCPHCEIMDGDLTLPRIRMRARALKARGSLQCLTLDYDELVEIQGERTEWDEGKKLIRAMGSLATELRVPVIIISQQRKSPNHDAAAAPRLVDLYGSGAKSKHATFVIYVDRPFVQNLQGDEAEARIFILKSREGRMGVIDCAFNVRTLEFEELQDGTRAK
jgi:replicative DNA helicase